jgi:predicted lipoprotein with Yx(FWY)xxD motif
MRSDGYKQWTYKGKPLYSSRSDSKPGDTNGNGVDGVWHIARP